MRRKAAENLAVSVEGRRTHMTQGAERHQTEGFILKSVYQARVDTTKIEQMMNRSVSFRVFEPESKLS
jgi:hypothetical protein